jgi:hypothetical protein
VVAAGISDDAAPPFVLGERRNLVISAAQLEGADRLKAFRLEPEPATVLFVLNQWCARSDTSQPLLRLTNLVERDDCVPPASVEELETRN